jgi:hypothetical protein
MWENWAPGIGQKLCPEGPEVLPVHGHLGLWTKEVKVGKARRELTVDARVRHHYWEGQMGPGGCFLPGHSPGFLPFEPHLGSVLMVVG